MHDAPGRSFYVDALTALNEAEVPYLLGGAYALNHYTGVVRDTKDIDLFCAEAVAERLLATLAARGYETCVTAPHWIGKAVSGEHFVDVIWSGANGVTKVDDAWHRHATRAELFGVPVMVAPPEEMIWSKAFVMERERYDGADVLHLIRSTGERLDWERLLQRFGPHWQLLLHYLILFRFDYPFDAHQVPTKVLAELLDRAKHEPPATSRICRGTLHSTRQFDLDVTRLGYDDARLAPWGALRPEQVP